MWTDLRAACRALRRDWVVATAVVAALSLGLAFGMSILTLLDAVFWRPLPVADPAGLVAVYTVSTKDGNAPYRSTSYADFEDIRRWDSSTAAFARIPVRLREGQASLNIHAELVTSGYFQLMGLRPLQGRVLSPPDDRAPAGAIPVAISGRLWERQFARSASALGSTLQINGTACIIVGILPDEFRGTILDWGGTPDVWIPLAHLTTVVPRFRGIDVWNNRDIRWLLMVARPKSGVPASRLQAGLDLIASQLAASYPATNGTIGYRLLPSQQARFWPGQREQASRFALLLGLAGLAILAVACFNGTGALLARALARGRETGTRLALGANRFRAARPVFLEGLVLTLASGAISIPLTLWLLAGLKAFPLPFLIPLSLNLAYDWRIVGFCLAVLALAMPVIGFLPAWIAMREGLASALRGAAVQGSGRRTGLPGLLRQSVVTAQIGVTFALLAAAVLLGRSLAELQGTDLGYEVRGITVAGISAANDGDRPLLTTLARVRAMPEVAQAALASELLPSTTRVVKQISAVGSAASSIPAHMSVVSDGYFETIRMPLLGGRDFRPAEASPVAIVNRQAAMALWGTPEAAGRKLQVRGEDIPREVVGVAADAKYHEVAESPLPYLFLPASQSMLREMVLHVAGGPVPPAAVAIALRKELGGTKIDTLEDHVAGRMSQPRLASGLASLVALAGLLLSALGVHNIVAQDVARQRRELGIRMALGATGTDIARSIAARTLPMVLCGLAAGVALSQAGAGVIRSQLYGAATPEPLIYGGVAAAMLLATAVAMVRPVLSATVAIRPNDLLREQ